MSNISTRPLPHSNASSGGLYTDIYRGQMVSEFEDWCFDPSRQAGDTGIETRNGLEKRTVEELLVDAAYLTGMPAPLVGEFRNGIGAEAQGAADPPQLLV